MDKDEIIKDLKVRQKALQKQYNDIAEGDDIDDAVWMAEVSAKLDLIDELVEKYTKKKKSKKGK